MKTNPTIKKRPGPQPEWRERVRLTAVAPAVRRGGRKAIFTAEEKRAKRAVWNAEYNSKKKEELRAAREASGVVVVAKRRTPLEGRVFGKLTVVEYVDTVGPKGQRKARWLLECGCGRAIVLRTDQFLIEHGRTHCGCVARAEREAVEKPAKVKSAPRRGPRLPGQSRVKTENPPVEYTPAELAEQVLQTAEKYERARLRALNATRARQGLDYVKPEPKAMDAGGWIRLLGTMRRSGARWADLTMELESAAACGVTREDVEKAERLKR